TDERAAAPDELVEDDAEGQEITPRIGTFAEDLLGGEVPGAAHAGHVHRLRERRDAVVEVYGESRQLHRTLTAEEHARGVEVWMDDPAAMGVVQRFGLLQGERRPRRRAQGRVVGHASEPLL